MQLLLRQLCPQRLLPIQDVRQILASKKRILVILTQNDLTQDYHHLLRSHLLVVLIGCM